MTSAVTQSAGAAPDSLQQVLDSVFAQPAYHWVEHSNPLAFLQRWWQAIMEWLNGLETSQPALYWFLFSAMIVILVAIIGHALVVVGRTLRSARAPADSAPQPLARTRGAEWYRREAVRLAGEGRFPEAMQADFLGLVLELDARSLLRFHPSKTPNEYTYEIRLNDTGRDTFRGLVRSLYGYAFAREPCGPVEFAQWRTLARTEQYASAV